MNGRFITKDDIRTPDPLFKQRFIHSFPDGCFISDDFKNKELTDFSDSYGLLIQLRPKYQTVKTYDCVFTFNECGNLIVEDFGGGILWKSYYDLDNNVIKEEESVNGSCRKYEYEYNDKNNVIKVEEINGDYWSKYSYDDINNTVFIEHQNGHKSINRPGPLGIPEELLNYLKLSTFLYNNK